ncbi:MAG: riboflavin synthase subunit alpha [Deltaproteobacteria bacterium GWA2_38_16]|nr:MAG: riboflavin synthase subunit alpha [Deltaproteobacteria bacterium GWA2_38_16]OGQ02567.1 MAG: riboflavin synthase subunit alpha [Deltaproteobacteria bacterium RIFCSPHIGHO2_02_FULL_38_15]OGQ30602.1 MAG: riboflavin synthase subunit alpha [Deltaproteobacteria bacterium RIFCSPLOWO2_01_FULL_38_9]OGQ60395.1 MAG: riboflavin synthase subunit alpha [Deltaproteobacteria bacterium RIFCSPLOWO2_12_FULL_38_8]HBQ20978.1 riboflavin synthase [Deltaproteobacteria bacterium]
MFTGIVEAIGRVVDIRPRLKEKGLRMMVEAPFYFKEDVGSGQSIAVNGTCLTVTEWKDHCFLTDISPETLDKTYFDQLSKGAGVNLERAMKFSDRVNGHWVTGHVDGIGKILKIESQGEFSKFIFEFKKEWMKYIVKKGSIAIDGISLTVNECMENQVEVMIIPETLQKTTLGQKKVGESVQVELDIIGKYVEKYIRP